jgi:hypothetical protein
MPRKPRRAPTRAPDPLDQFSTWDIRIAKLIYYGIILASAITILGIWLTIIGALIESGRWEQILSLGAGVFALIIVGIVVAHLFLLVLFYTLFRGGILKLCTRLFKDRLLAKKYEDYTTLRLLIAVALISLYIFLITLFVVILPSVFWQVVAEIWSFFFINVLLIYPGAWVLFIGLAMFFIILLVYLGFVLWNHGVFFVLKRVKRIEEEYEIEEELKAEELHDADEETLQNYYEKQTGKRAIYRGKETKGYSAWKKEIQG